MSKTEPKQVLIWRNDLRNTKGEKCRTGKVAAQLAHASMAAILNLGRMEREYSDLDGRLTSVDYVIPLHFMQFEYNGNPNIERPEVVEWLEGRFTKICVSVDSEQELVDIIEKAKSAGLVTSLITDAGLTEFGGIATITCGAVGPGYPEDIDQFTKHLKLL